MKEQKLDLIKDPIPHLIIKMAIPVSVGFFFHTMFNVVDTYFASQINSVAVIVFYILSFYFNFQLKGIWSSLLIVNYLSVFIFLIIVNNRMQSLGIKFFKTE